MNGSRLVSKVVATAGLLALCAGAVYAQGITPVFLSATPSGSNTNFAYRLELLDNTTVQSGNFLTIFDFAGLTGTPTFTPTASGASFAVNTPFTGSATPNAFQTDSPTLRNIDLVYNGTTISNNTGTSIVLGTLNALSTFPLNTAGQFTAYGVGSVNNQTIPPSPATNNSFINGPNAIAVPEPGTWTLLVGTGITGLAALRRRRINRTN